jgi:hypothetical protein
MATRRKSTRGRLEVGSTVRFRFGITDVTAKVVEDRGPLGRDGERIYRVRFWFREPGGPSETEIEASRLKLVHRAA